MMPFAPVAKNPVYLQVADQLREAILSGELSPGDRLPAERELCETFGASRTSIREALRALQAQGLIVAGAGAPARAEVAPELGPHTREALVGLLRLARVDLADLVEFRCVLETAALRRAARSSDAARLAEAHAALEEMREPEVSIEHFDEADVRFHVALVRASGNEAMHLVMLALREPVAAHLLEALRTRRSPRATLRRLAAEHEEILAAVERGDGERAAELVDGHIRGFYRTLRGRRDPRRAA